MNVFGGYEKFKWWIFLGDHHKTGQFWVVIFIHLRVCVFRSRYKMGIFLGIANISNIFWVCLIFLIFWRGGGGKGDYAGSKPMYQETSSPMGNNRSPGSQHNVWRHHNLRWSKEGYSELETVTRN